jgi:ABC-type lipoprotein export system ATPase subunit
MDTLQGIFSSVGLNIQVEGVSKSYWIGTQENSVLRNVSFNVAPGEAVVIQGPSGGGKSTLLHMIGMIDSADGGRIMVGNENILAITAPRQQSSYRLSKVGFVFQAFNLIAGLTALENIRLPPSIAGKSETESAERAQKLLSLVGLEHKSGSRPDELSGGEQQRVAVALALANDPPIILADEPTGNLDSKNASAVADLLVSLAHSFGKSVLITTHDAMVGGKADRTLHLLDGSLERRA